MIKFECNKCKNPSPCVRYWTGRNTGCHAAHWRMVELSGNEEHPSKVDCLKSRIAELESAILRCCRNCWANDATDAAQCRVCGLKDALKGAENE